jgi:hypothetical protein
MGKTTNVLIEPLQNLLRHIERDLANNAPEWKPTDVPEYVQAVLALRELGIEHIYENPDVDDVVNDVLQRSEEYGFTPDEDMVGEAVAESAGLLNITLTDQETAAACERIMAKRGESAELQRG